MTERTIFLAALEYDDPAERSAYLDRACAGQSALRAQVEQLLTAHEQSGSFMSRPAPERLAGYPAALSDDDLRTSPAAGDEGEGLDFLEPSDTPGSLGRLGHYEVQEVIGRGGMGVVLRAFDETLHRVVAVKVMARQLAASATARRRFSREARATAAVSHDHVVTIHAVEDAGALPYIVMQYLAGCSLQERLDRTGPLPLAEILRIGMQTAAGLAAAHAQGLVHRDVKPANILLENGVERVKLTDFGLARAADDASLTQSGTVAGTPLFMSPEQAEGKPVDHRSDLFSLGSVLYAMCTGRAPFRASTSMGVLKRVCEDAPTPIREINPEIPDWLAAVVGRLHGKDPAGRFQTAAEVADLLGQLLAHVQHPSVAPLPAVGKPADKPPAPPRPGGRGGRWPLAAVLLLATCAGLGTAEATGVTKVRATVTRIFTPDGTLAVETDDPDVKVTVEGDGGLVIAGAGPQEVRLRPGSYRLRAVKDGKPAALDRDLVTITRGDKQIVRVRLEAAVPAAAAPKAEPGAFVLVAAGTERKFDTLAEAVLNAADGDTIEVRGNGPFVTKPISARSTALTIRAAPGFRPVIRLEDGDRVPAPLLRTDSALMLEGLDLERRGKPTAPVAEHVIVYSDRASLHVGNCRLAIQGLDAVACNGSPRCVLRNCELAIPQAGGVDWFQPARGELELDNCIILRPLQPVLGLHYADPPAEEPVDVSIRLRRNTWVSGGVWWLACDRMKAGAGLKPVRVEATANLFDVGRMVDVADYRRDRTPLTRAEALHFLPRLINWRGRENIYPQRLANWVQWFASVSDAPRIKDLAEWGTFWGDKEIASSQARIRYRGGDLHAKAATSPESIAPEDCRLRPDSAGYRAGKDGKDLGADVDLVGPGAAYERWKKTPEYQQWLKETGQAKEGHGRLPGGPPLAVVPFDTPRAKAHQTAWAEHLGVPVEFTNSIGMKFRLIPPGEFTMGTPRDDANQIIAAADGLLEHERKAILSEGTPHPVRLTQPFYLGQFEVTRAQFRRFVEATKHKTEAEQNGLGGWSNFDGKWVRRPEHVWSAPGQWELSDDEPACILAWSDAQAFCEWLSKVEQRRYALPTEAQWEFACRAGTKGPTYDENGENRLDIAWTRELVGEYDLTRHRPQPVGRKRPNAFGLYDMLGNVWEHCADRYAPGPEQAELRIDPTGPPKGDLRVLRGGAWYRSGKVFARASARLYTEPNGVVDAGIGFRVAIVGDLKSSVPPKP